MTKKRVLLCVPHNSSFRKPLVQAFSELDFTVDEFDYRFLIGNLSLSSIYFDVIYAVFILIMTKVFSPKNLSKRQSKTINQLLIKKCQRTNPDILFVVKGETLEANTIDEIKLQKIVTICWMVDYIFQKNIWPWFQILGSKYDVVIQSEIGVIKKVDRLPWKNKRLYMLAAADTKIEKNIIKTLPKYNVSFVGTFNPHRERYLKELIGFGLNIWGYQWEKSSLAKNFKGVMPYKDLLRTYARSKIVIAGNQSKHIAVTNRVFEAGSVGAFVLMEYNPYIENVFKIDEEIVCYKNPKELKEKVEYYLKNERERKKIARNLYKKIILEHTYKKRLSYVLTNL